MQSKPKILVLKMRELIYTGIFLFLAIVLIILLILNFGGVFEILTQIFVWVSLALTVISLITYIVQNKNVISMQE